MGVCINARFFLFYFSPGNYLISYNKKEEEEEG